MPLAIDLDDLAVLTGVAIAVAEMLAVFIGIAVVAVYRAGRSPVERRIHKRAGR